jgi:hypothetical protein
MFEVGDAVAVKPGVRDIDFDVDIGGWQGRVEEIEPHEREGVLLVHWDSVTLREMPDEMIEECEMQGLSWALYPISASDVEPARPRDTQADVDQVVEELEKKHAWIGIGPEGRAIQKVLVGVDPDDVVAAFDAWNDHMEEHLDFPFEAKVDEFQKRGPLRGRDQVTVVSIAGLDYAYGVIVHLKRGSRRYDFPLCDLAVLDTSSPNHDLVQEYRVWFANY